MMSSWDDAVLAPWSVIDPRAFHTGNIEALTTTKNVIPASRRIPVEIIAEIIICGDFLQRPVTLETWRQPWTLGHVSRSWRAATKSITELWANIQINDFTVPVVESSCDVLREMLARAGARPLTLRLQFHPWAGSHTISIIQLLVEESHRWLELDLCHTWGLYAYFSGVQGRLPRLERLTLTSPSYESAFSYRCFQHAPSLSRLTLFGFCSAGIDRLQLPWSQITRLMHDSRLLNDTFQLLRRVPNLIDLESYAGPISRSWFDPSWIPSAAMTLPHLRQISFSQSMLQLVQCLALPSLESISWRNYAEDKWNWALCDMIYRSRCSLKRLEYVGFIPEWATLDYMLNVMPELVTLAFPSVVDDGKNRIVIARILDYIRETPSALPMLETIELDTSILGSIDCTELIVRFVQSRYGWKDMEDKVSALRTVRFTPGVEVQPDIFAVNLGRFDAMRQQGLTMTFTKPKRLSFD
ncbi:hypothetical protein C8J56DRAFT_245713 [Mycena floridula]|nr:hypothetical protein C8J56DRAFT_245713 [Mycena floridula]